MILHYSLTPADIMDLRSSIPGGRQSDGCAMVPAPFIIYGPSDDTYYLHAFGYTWCASKRIEVIAAAMRSARLDSNWLARAMAPGETCEEVLLSVEERTKRAAAKRVHEAHAKLALATKRDLATTDLDDFL